MSGAISDAIEAMGAATQAFRDHGLLVDSPPAQITGRHSMECVVCHRLLEGGLHAKNCPIDLMRHAIRRLNDFKSEMGKL